MMKNLFAMFVCFTLSFFLTDYLKKTNQTSNTNLTLSNDVPFKEIIRVDSKGAISPFPNQVPVNKIEFGNGTITFTYINSNLVDSMSKNDLLLDLTTSDTSKYCVKSTSLDSNYINNKCKTTHITYKQ